MERKLGTETLDKVEDWFSNTWYGEKFLESQEREKELEQQLIDRGGLGGWITEQRNTPNQTEQNILKGISDFTKVDERITTPATYLTIGALGGKLSKVQGSKAASFKRGHGLKKQLEKSKTKRTNVGQPARLQTIDINSRAVDSVFNMPPAEFQKIVRLARQEGINSLTLARRFNQQQGTIKRYLDSKGKTDLTEGAKDLEGKFEYQGNFMFDRDGRIHLNKIDPSSKVAWDYWLDLTARKSGYESMKEMVKVMRDWPEEKFQEHMTELWYGSTEDGTPTNPFHYLGYSEHKKAKASKKERLAKIQRKNPDWNQTQISEELVKKSSETYDMDWLHDTEWIDHTGTLRNDGIGLGDRNAPENMLPLFNSRWKSLKDVAEGVGYGGELAPGPLFSFSDGTWRNPNQRFYIDVEDPGKKTKQYLRHNPGDLVIRRASNNKIIGNLGSYLDALYPKDESLKTRLQIAVPKTINPSTGKFFSSIKEFRRHVVLERINIILRNTHTLPSNATKRKRYIKEKIQEDMDRLFAQYPFLKPTKVLSDEIATDADLSEEGYIKRGQGKREGIPELGDERFKVKEGPFKDVVKTEQFNPRQVIIDAFKNRPDEIDE